ncbi:MAG: galactokinase family protein [Acidobacteriota bacterium]|jgi:galactokinase
MQNNDTRLSRLELAREKFVAHFGPGEIEVLRAPARINILGEHVDYVSYLPTASLPFGSHEHEMLILYRPVTESRIRGLSGHAAYEPFEFALTAEFGEGEWATQVFNRPAPLPHWSNYIRGAIAYAQWRHPAQIERGMDLLIDSTIPPGGGSSSSSAIVVLAGAAIRRANAIDYTLADLAWESSQAEWYLGTRGGALDHTAICLGQRHHALLMDHYRRTSEPIPLFGQEWRWVTFFSHPADKGREVMLEYNERAAVSRILIPALLDGAGTLATQIERLPEEITLAEFERRFPDHFADCRAAFPALVSARLEIPLRIRQRALHHLGEAERVAAAVEMLRGVSRNDVEATGPRERALEEIMEQLGDLIDQSHQSLCNLYEVSNGEVDQLVGSISQSPRLIEGRRLMGGGFGGNVLVLCRADKVEQLIDQVAHGFYAPRGRDPRTEGAIMISTPGEGLSPLVNHSRSHN